MDMRDAERYLERTLQVTQEMYQRQTRRIERELTLDGISKRLSQFVEVAYLGVILSVFPVALYSLGNAIPPELPLRTIIVEKVDFLVKSVSDEVRMFHTP